MGVLGKKCWIELQSTGANRTMLALSDSAPKKLVARTVDACGGHMLRQQPDTVPQDALYDCAGQLIRPNKTALWSIERKGTAVSAIRVSAYKLKDIDPEANIGRCLVVVSQIGNGYPEDTKSVKAGGKALGKAMKALEPACLPMDRVRLGQLFGEGFELSDKAVKAPNSLGKGKVALMVGLPIAVGVAGYALRKNPAFAEMAASALDGIAKAGLTSTTEESEQPIPEQRAQTPTNPMPRVYDRPVRDGVPRQSAKHLGDMLGLSAAEVNKRLCALGYLEGSPGNWKLTEKGCERAVLRYEAPYNYGYHFPMWDESIVYELGDPDEYRERIEKVLAQIDQEES